MSRALPRPSSEPDASVLQFPCGLLGFENIKEFRLVGKAEEDPFLWLEPSDDAAAAFLVLPLRQVLPDYRPQLPAEDAGFLQLSHPDEALLLGIVTLRPDGQATVNLKGPLVINGRSRIGKQIVPLNAAIYRVQHPLVSATGMERSLC